MRRLLCVQIKSIIITKYFLITAWILIILVLVNFTDNIMHYWGMDYMQLHDGVKLLLLSNYSETGYYFLQIFPVLVILPAGFALTEDKKSGFFVLLQSRVGTARYYLSKAIAVFLSSFLVFAVPLAAEMCLHMIAFPVSVISDPDNLGVYDYNYVYAVKNLYTLSDIYVYNRWLYMLLHIFKLGMASGILNLFVMSVSLFVKRFRVLLFIPVYLLMIGLTFAGSLYPMTEVSSNYFFYFQVFSRVKISLFAFFTVLLILFLISVGILFYHARVSDQL